MAIGRPDLTIDWPVLEPLLGPRGAPDLGPRGWPVLGPGGRPDLGPGARPDIGPGGGRGLVADDVGDRGRSVDLARCVF